MVIRKTYPSEVKTVDAEAGVYEAMISTEAVDRDGDVIVAAGVDLVNFMRNPVVMFAHNYGEPPVAKALAVEVLPGRGLKSRFQFAPKGTTQRADEVHALWKAGFLNATSIGFIPKEAQERPGGEGERGGRVFASCELLEFSIVPVPANQEALRLALKIFDLKDEPAKSPPCRQQGESEEDCRSRKIAEIRRDNPGMSQEQCVAIAISMCGHMCDDADVPEVKGAIPSHESPKADPDTAWDGPGVVASLPNARAALRRVFAWVDPEGDPDAKSSYKLPHHLANGEVVLRGVNNAAARLSRTDIPDGDKAGVERHLSRHQDQFKAAEMLRGYARALEEVAYEIEQDELTAAGAQYAALFLSSLRSLKGQ